MDNEVKASNDESQIRSAYKSLVEIYMTCMNISKNWWPLFCSAFESVIGDQNVRDHCKLYIKYLKILRNLNKYEKLLKCCVELLKMYPTEYITMDIICQVYVNSFASDQHNISFDVS